MRGAIAIWGMLCAAGFAVLVGCAAGTTPDNLGDEGEENALPNRDDDDAGNESVTVPEPSSSTDEPDAGPTSSPGAVDSGAGGTDSGTSGGTDAGTDAGTDGGTTTTSCAALNTCQTASSLGSISGDSNNDSKTAQGTTSKWFTVQVTEDDSSVFGAIMSMQASLSVPAGAVYQLYVYVGEQQGMVECALPVQQANPNAVEWGESGAFSNGDSDTRTATVEVRYISGTCNSSSPWTLTVNGHIE